MRHHHVETKNRGNPRERPSALLEVENLTVQYGDRTAQSTVVDRFNMSLTEGRSLGIVGESGSGKSSSVLAILGLLRWQGATVSGSVRYRGEDLVAASEKRLRSLRGHELAFVGQNAIGGLNPVYRIGHQVSEPLRLHTDLSRRERMRRTFDLLDLVGLPDPERIAGQYPHQLSGGQKQRVGIATALMLNPTILIADEPTTALDATVQSQILRLLADLAQTRGMSLILVSHDLGAVARACDEIVVMYAGHVVEHGRATEVLNRPRHPYTNGLINATPRMTGPRRMPAAIPGSPPTSTTRTSGCPFAPRCDRATKRCEMERPSLALDAVRGVKSTECACHYPLYPASQE